MLDVADYQPRLKTLYAERIRAKLKEEFSYKNDMMIPRLEKIVLNMGVGEAVADSKKVKAAHDDLMLIAGQKPVITKAKNSIAGFKVREDMPLGVKVTLRGDRMYEFFDRLIYVAMPRIRDFRGVKGTSFDGNGNYAMGIREHIVFPEIEYDKVDQIWGMDIVIGTTARTDAEAKALLWQFNMPFMDLVGTTEMAKKSMIAREVKRQALVDKYAAKRAALKAIASDADRPMEERFKARLKLAEMPRNSSATRLHSRCKVTGRPKAYYRKLQMSRIALRDLASQGQIPGMVKSSW